MDSQNPQIFSHWTVWNDLRIYWTICYEPAGLAKYLGPLLLGAKNRMSNVLRFINIWVRHTNFIPTLPYDVSLLVSTILQLLHFLGSRVAATGEQRGTQLIIFALKVWPLIFLIVLQISHHYNSTLKIRFFTCMSFFIRILYGFHYSLNWENKQLH